MKDIIGKNPSARIPRHGGHGPSLTIRELGTDEHEDEDNLSTLEIAVEINSEKVVRAAGEAAAPAGNPQDGRSPKGENPAGRCAGPRGLGLNDIENTRKEDLVQDENRPIPKLIRVLETVEQTTDSAGDVKMRGVLSKARAIKLYCLECAGGTASEATFCHLLECPLWPFRLGAGIKSKLYRQRVTGAFTRRPDIVKELKELGFGLEDFLRPPKPSKPPRRARPQKNDPKHVGEVGGPGIL